MEKYTISILTYSEIDKARQCVESVIKHSSNYELILTANGNEKAEEYFEKVKSENPSIKITVVKNKDNLGFIKPNNHAFSLSKTNRFVMLNDDCIVCHGWLDALYKPFTEWPNTAVASGPESNRSALRSDLSGFRTRGAFEYIEFSTVMLNSEIVRKHGLFPDWIQFAYGEDATFCLMYRRMGYTLHLVPITILHHGQSTSRKISGIKEFERRNHFEMFKRFTHYLKVRKFDYPIRIRRMAAIGDVILTTAIIRQLKKENPTARIFIETQFPDIFKGNPNISGAGYVINQTTDMQFINLDMSYENTIEKHIVSAYAETAGVVIENNSPELFPENELVEKYSYLKNKKTVAVHMGPCTWPGKQWPFENFLQLIAKIINKGFDVILVGGQSRFSCPHGATDLRGSTTILGTAAILKHCVGLVTIDSAPLHIAQSVGCPVVALFGVTSPQFILTNGSKSYPVQADPALCDDIGIRHRISGGTFVNTSNQSMVLITVDMVMDAFNKMVSSK